MSKIKFSFLFLVILLFASAAGCAPGQTPADIGIVLAGLQPCEIKAGDTLPISLKGTIPTNAEVAWSATGGSFKPASGFPTVYTAPTQPGKVVLTVNVTISGIRQVYNVECLVKAEAAALVSTPTEKAAPSQTPSQTAAPSATPTATQTATRTPTPTTEPSPTPTLTPTPDWLMLASTENLEGWTADFRNARGRAILNNVTQGTVEDGNALRLAFDITNWGYVTLTHDLKASDMQQTRGVRFAYQGGPLNNTATNNTIEFKLLFHWPGDNADTVFGFVKNGVTDTNAAWVTVEMPYDQFECWWPENLCARHRNTMDFRYISRMDYVVSNKPDKGDTGGPGYILFASLLGVR